MNNTNTLPQASSEGHENRLIKEEEIQLYEVVTPGAKTKILKGVIVATGQVVRTPHLVIFTGVALLMKLGRSQSSV